MKFLKQVYYILVSVFCCLLLFNTCPELHSQNKKQKPKSKKSVTKKSVTKKPVTKKLPPNSHTFLTDSLLSSGIAYKELLVSINGIKHAVHIIQVDLTNPKASVEIIKGGNNIIELERLPDMLNNDKLDTTKRKFAGGINANFWRAVTNFPIGPTIINGEVAELRAYKKWTSTFFNDEGLPFISFFDLQGEILTKQGAYRVPITAVNHRKDSMGVVIYNKYGGDVIPYINSKKVQELLLQSLENVFIDEIDSTESIDNVKVQSDALLDEERSSKLEYEIPKLVVNYLDTPAVNTFYKCEVVDIVYGAVPMPEFGCIISLGSGLEEEHLPVTGEIIYLHYWTNIHENEVFTNSVSGTPRLVREGESRHEAIEEGSSKKKFINGALPRTAIGYNKDKTKLFLVAVPTGRKQDGTTGASLQQLADIMDYIGCYEAQNLDGGGSTNMVVGGVNVINPAGSRRISVAVGAIELKEQNIKKLPRKR